ncbi:MAG: restriction endonuclease subunit S [Candidatus Bathyarchaeota archaeon]
MKVIPYELPIRWTWIRLCDYFYLQTGANPSTKISNYWGGNIKWLKSGEVNLREIFDCNGRITEEGLSHSNCKILLPDSALIALNGQGKTRGTVAMLRTEAACNQSLVSMSSYDKQIVIPEYLYYFLKSNYMRIREITGHKQRHGLNMKIIGNMLVAIPPSKEQVHIVKKVNQLLKLCDELEEKVNENQKNSELLMEAVLKEAFES